MVCGSEYGDAWKTLGAYQGLRDGMDQCPAAALPGHWASATVPGGRRGRCLEARRAQQGRREGAEDLAGTKAEKAESVINVAAAATTRESK